MGTRDLLVGQIGQRWSGRAMARTGLRMMPTFPSPSLKFRTVGFPQYGFKASLSGRAFLPSDAVKPAPGIPASRSSFLAALCVGRVTFVV